MWMIALLLLPLAAPAAAQPMRATYEVRAGGMAVLELEAIFDVSAAGYRLETTARTRGLAATFVPGEQVSRVAGAWQGVQPLPGAYASDGTWRGRARRVALEWQQGAPVLTALEPTEAEEREPVSAEQRRGTLDALSAMALLARSVQANGTCDAEAAVFDGRRRTDFRARQAGWSRIAPLRGAWAGDAMRCEFEGRLVAGFRHDQARETAAAPQSGTAWIAAPYPGAPPIPVRIDMATRWFGTATAILLRAEPLALAIPATNRAQ
jgi:hypothetical protein